MLQRQFRRDPLDAAVQRLIMGSSRSQGLLTAKVREQPFTVVLLDELEKAHAAFFDLLLQVLGEAGSPTRLDVSLIFQTRSSS